MLRRKADRESGSNSSNFFLIFQNLKQIMKGSDLFLIQAIIQLFLLVHVLSDTYEEENYGVKYASPCEVCKIMVDELERKLEETSKAGGLVETGYHLDQRLQKKKQYKNSELQLIESMESACQGVMEYKVHKERTDSTRFARGQSQTFSTLHNLVAKGVKVDLGIPYELWDKPSAEISQLKTQCDDMMEKYESEIEDWFHRRTSEVTLKDYLCKKVVLKNKNYKCLYEVPSEIPPEVNGDATASSRSKKTEL